jgi:hypothetical protein
LTPTSIAVPAALGFDRLPSFRADFPKPTGSTVTAFDSQHSLFRRRHHGNAAQTL